MMEDVKIRVAFIGDQSNGKIAYDYLLKNRFVDLVFSLNSGKSTNLARGVKFGDGDKHHHGTCAEHLDAIKDAAPDLIIVAGWSELLPESLISIAPMGTIGFHPSKLPHNRGRAVLAWQIEEGSTATALTMFYYNSLPDAGDIIAQHEISIHLDDYINDVLDKVDWATGNLMHAYFPLIRRGVAPRLPQDWNVGLFRRAREDADSMINWDRPAIEIYNKIRSISRPYPGAIADLDGKRLKVWRADVVNERGGNHDPGTVVSHENGNITVSCRGSSLVITDYEEL
jgi:methionyl-tRNA formyltransferase